MSCCSLYHDHSSQFLNCLLKDYSALRLIFNYFFSFWKKSLLLFFHALSWSSFSVKKYTVPNCITALVTQFLNIGFLICLPYVSTLRLGNMLNSILCFQCLSYVLNLAFKGYFLNRWINKICALKHSLHLLHITLFIIHWETEPSFSHLPFHPPWNVPDFILS